MAISRIYCDTALHADGVFTLDKTASHHLLTVLRARVGQAVCLFNGDGNNYLGIIESADKNRSCNIHITEVAANANESPLHTCLIQGISRNDRMDFTLQKATELGVNRIIAFRTDLNNQRVSFERQQKKLGHWQAVIQSAAEQSGRAQLPQLQLVRNLATAIDSAKEYSTHQGSQCGNWALIPDAGQTLHSAVTSSAELSSVNLIVGPERGLSESECKTAESARFEAVTLGPRVMRTETAALAALSVLQALEGDFS